MTGDFAGTSDGDVSVLFRLLFLFIVVPLVELVLLEWLCDQTSLATTILIILVTGFVGATLARRQGLRTWQRIHQQLAAGQTPAADLLDGVLILLAGAVLITPGLITDACGFALLVPPVRQFLRERLSRWFKARTFAKFQTFEASFTTHPDGFGHSDPDEAVIVDADFTRIDDDSTGPPDERRE